MKTDEKARRLMHKHPNGITVGELQSELPDERERRDVFSRMIYLGQCDKDDEIFGG